MFFLIRHKCFLISPHGLASQVTKRTGEKFFRLVRKIETMKYLKSAAIFVAATVIALQIFSHCEQQRIYTPDPHTHKLGDDNCVKWDGWFLYMAPVTSTKDISRHWFMHILPLGGNETSWETRRILWFTAKRYIVVDRPEYLNTGREDKVKIIRVLPRRP